MEDRSGVQGLGETDKRDGGRGKGDTGKRDVRMVGVGERGGWREMLVS